MIDLRAATLAMPALALAFVSTPASLAGEVDVVEATVVRADDGSFSFSATLQHADEGWDHYADRWDIVAPDGTVLGSRVLAHPHVDEQPFTRSLRGVTIPDDIGTVTIRANDSVHGGGGQELSIRVPHRRSN